MNKGTFLRPDNVQGWSATKPSKLWVLTYIPLNQKKRIAVFVGNEPLGKTLTIHCTDVQATKQKVSRHRRVHTRICMKGKNLSSRKMP